MEHIDIHHTHIMYIHTYIIHIYIYSKYLLAGGSLTTTECGHLRPQTPVKDSGSLMTTKCGHLRPQNLIFTDRANKTSTVHGVTCDHRMRSLTTTKHFHNRTTEGGGVGGMITYHKALLQYYSALQSTTP